MRKPDAEVREVVCSETGKPMPKIPLWMADVDVKFVSDEARQRHAPSHGVPEPSRRSASSLEDEKEKDAVDEEIEDEAEEEAEAEEIEEEEFEEE